MENHPDSNMANETNHEHFLIEEIKKIKHDMAAMKNENISYEARIKDLEETQRNVYTTMKEYEARIKDLEETKCNNEARIKDFEETQRNISFLRKSKPKLCIYGKTEREADFVRAFKKLEEKAYTFEDLDEMTEEIPIVLVCECTLDRNIHDLDGCLAIITESDYKRTTIIYIREVFSSQQMIDQFTTRERIKLTEERHKYQKLDYRILDMLFDKKGILTCKTNKDAKERIETFVNEYTVKVETRKTRDD